uniref:Uncharacterized protein n=1 Tax=Anguilla anguilla TaxID=7936 RepID=A0A0E9TTP1_ANGAN
MMTGNKLCSFKTNANITSGLQLP